MLVLGIFRCMGLLIIQFSQTHFSFADCCAAVTKRIPDDFFEFFSSQVIYGEYIIEHGDSAFMKKRLAHGQAVLQSSYQKLKELQSLPPLKSSN